MTNKSSDSLAAELNLETGRIPWRELQRFFANGSALAVDAELDLLHVADAMAQDDAGLVNQWMQAGQLGRVSDDQAKAWYESDATLWALVIKPWVLVQDKGGQNEP